MQIMQNQTLQQLGFTRARTTHDMDMIETRFMIKFQRHWGHEEVKEWRALKSLLNRFRWRPVLLADRFDRFLKLRVKHQAIGFAKIDLALLIEICKETKIQSLVFYE